MRQSVKLGRIAGVPVGVHWSVLVIFWLIAWELATLVFPGGSQQVTAADWIAGAVAAVLFMGSLLAHELSHAVVAKHNGIGVSSITLWLFGGVAQLDREALTAGVEFRVAAAGPAASVAAAAIFGGAHYAMAGLGVTGLVVAVAGWLGWINLLLAGFNLVPAAPLDGGRILRAILWRRSGDRTAAAVSAARAGRIFAYVLIGLGLVEILAGNLFGLWPAFLGWFLLSAARAEEQQAVLRGSVGGLRVADVMAYPPPVVDGSVSVAAFVEHHLLVSRIDEWLVLDAAGVPVGVVTLDAVRHVPFTERAVTRIWQVAAPLSVVARARADEPLLQVLERVAGSEVFARFGVVVTDATGAVVGLLSPAAVERAARLHPGTGTRPRTHVPAA